MLLIPFAGEVIHVSASARERAHESTCISNMHGIGRALLEYSQDWDQTFPPAKHWADAAASHIKIEDVLVKPDEIPHYFQCANPQSPYSYVFNVNLGRLRLEKLLEPARTFATYEGDAYVFNAAGDGIVIPRVRRHMDGGNIAFADGHANYRKLSDAQDLNWQNKSTPNHDSSKP